MDRDEIMGKAQGIGTRISRYLSVVGFLAILIPMFLFYGCGMRDFRVSKHGLIISSEAVIVDIWDKKTNQKI